MRTSRAMSEENSTLVQWLTVRSWTGSLRTKAAILSLVTEPFDRKIAVIAAPRLDPGSQSSEPETRWPIIQPAG